MLNFLGGFGFNLFWFFSVFRKWTKRENRNDEHNENELSVLRNAAQK